MPWRKLVSMSVLAILVIAVASLVVEAQNRQAKPAYASSWEEYQARLEQAQGGTNHTLATIPDWSGIWRVRKNIIQAYDERSGVHPQLRSIHRLTHAESAAKLTPKYQADYDRKVQNILNDIEWDRLTDCLPIGMMRWMAEFFEREFIVTPDQTWMLIEQMRETRRIYTDGRGHLPDGHPDVRPQWTGNSIGFWDGDTLVIHTKDVKAGEYFRGQPHYSFKATSVERWRMIDPTTLEAKITIYDPESLLEPYPATFTYVKSPDDPNHRLHYMSCEEGNLSVKSPEGGTTHILPGEPGYRDLTTFGIPEVALDSMPE